MVHTCIVCHVSSKDNTGNVSFHLFPKNKVKRLKWCDALGLSMATPNQSVCSNHFGQDCYNFSLNRKILKPFAVPSLLFESIPELDLSMISPIPSTSRTMHKHSESK
ncbi:THAP domain-containing protein 1-like [Sipha flava]|uniref:THAP domain-containing protein 1-like n=1 Tax=Sipha flava TaxID=143950 RepID=A0A8B8FJJ6_9HEMI|nr:THAP domain-containing protein 1-like [Sipha flava]